MLGSVALRLSYIHVCENSPPRNRNTNNARGQMTPQWRLSLKDLGQSGNGAPARRNSARNNLWGDDGTRVRRSWAQVTKQQRRGGANASATEMRQQRIHAVEKTRSQRPDQIPVGFLLGSEVAEVRAMHAHPPVPRL